VWGYHNTLISTFVAGQQKNTATSNFPKLTELWQGTILREKADQVCLLKELSLNVQQAEKLKGAGVGNWLLHLTT
jgi:hypothetical protein